MISNQIPDKYKDSIRVICGIYNRLTEGNQIDVGSVNMNTSIRDDLGITRIELFHAEAMLESRYPSIDGISHAPGIRTVGDAISYIERGSKF
ncbi:MAG: hypothetical protein JW789_04390 [Candidatus Aenigmarchaeota archaeon]|nr:hypothetical protein [Candidatus Aenigmarchaeota archaeon]